MSHPGTNMEDSDSSNVFNILLRWGVLPNPQLVMANIRSIREKYPKASNEDIVNRIIVAARRLATVQGIIASLPGAIPGIGTMAQAAIILSSVTPETILLFRKMAYIQMSIAYMHGYDICDHLDDQKIHADRAEEFYTILGLMTGAVIPAKIAAKKYGSKFVTVQISKNLSGKVLRDINKKIGFTLLTKFGVKRGGIAIGKVIPLGVGAGIGGAINYTSINQFSSSARKFYESPGEMYAIPA